MTEPLYEITPAVEARVFAGDVHVRVLRAGWFRSDAGAMFGVVPRPLWSKLVRDDELGRIACRLNLLLIEAAGRRLLVETGTGARVDDRQRQIKGIEGGDPVAALRAVGEDPKSIDLVVVTHLHYDHAGGMVGADDRPAFPNARYVVQRAEVEAAHSGELRQQGLMEVEQLEIVRAAGQLEVVDGEAELVAGVSVARVGGHTRGSQLVHIGAGPPERGERAVFFGDLIQTRWQLPVRWTSAYDDYPIDVVEARNVLLARVADEGWWCYFTHDPGPIPIRIERAERGYRVRES